MAKAKRPVAATAKAAAPKERSFHLEFKNTDQKLAWTEFQQNDILFMLGAAGVGKSFISMAFAINEVLARRKKRIILTRPIIEAGESLGYLPGPQPLDAKILTPHGWTTMGELKVGDMAIGRNGKPTKILGIFPKGKKPVYKVTTTEGTSTECCEDHLWHTRTAEDRKRSRSGCVRSTKEIIETLHNSHGKINHFLPRNEIVEFASREIPLPAYTLGVILGDGHIGNSISFASIDAELTGKVYDEMSLLGCNVCRMGDSISYNISSKSLKNKKTARRIRLTNIATSEVNEYGSVGIALEELPIHRSSLNDRCRNQRSINGVRYEFIAADHKWTNPIKNILYNLGLEGKRSFDKFIPDEYKFASVQDRIDLLRGLMDTDGTVKKNGEASFSTVSRQLAIDVIELVRSLGGRAVLRKRGIRPARKSRIQSKRESYEFNISLPEQVNPFFISRKSYHYSQKYIHSIGIKSIEPAGEKETQCILVEDPEHLYITDDYIVTHNTFDEKVAPYMLPLMDCMTKLVGPNNTGLREIINKSIEVAPLAYMRGRSFTDSVCIFDEAQNATVSQLKMYMTRIDENSKMIINGDPFQSDLPGPVALNYVTDKLQGVEGIGILNFKPDSVVRHPIIMKILDRL